MIACGDKLLICGGSNSHGTLKTTEWFNGSISKGPQTINKHLKPSCVFLNSTLTEKGDILYDLTILCRTRVCAGWY